MAKIKKPMESKKIKKGEVEKPHYHDSLNKPRVYSKEISSSARIVAGKGDNVGVLDGKDATYRIYAGSNDPASAPFSVTQDGLLIATDATLTIGSGNALTVAGGGDIVIESGGGLSIEDGGSISVDDGGSINLGDGGDILMYATSDTDNSQIKFYKDTTEKAQIFYGYTADYLNISGRVIYITADTAIQLYHTGAEVYVAADMVKLVSSTSSAILTDSFTFTQADTTGAVPVVVMNQDDVDQAYINFAGGTLYTGKSGQDEYVQVEWRGATRYLRLFA